MDGPVSRIGWEGVSAVARVKGSRALPVTSVTLWFVLVCPKGWSTMEFSDSRGLAGPPLDKRPTAVEGPDESWIFAAEGSESGTGLASWALAMPVFVLSWVTVGVLIGLYLTRRGHERRTMVALGAGLGPLMFVVASDRITCREREAWPLELAPGIDHGGDLEVLVLLEGRVEGLNAVVPTLEAVAAEIRTLTLAQVVNYESLECDEDDVVGAASSMLVAAREVVPISGPRLMLFPGRPETVARQFTAGARRTLVLHAVAEGPSGPDRL